jgi:hypothetical protein
MELLFEELKVADRVSAPLRVAKTKLDTRESWLLKAAELMTPWLKAAGGGSTPKYRVSVGWPLGRRKMGGKGTHAIGQCFHDKASKDGHHEIFISPELEDPTRVLDVLLHELVHAFVGLEAKHGKDFKLVAEKVGLTGKMTATLASDDLKPKLVALAKTLGAYPHSELRTGGDELRPKQGTRMLKVECPKCGYSVRTTQKWLDVGLPTCVCGTKMVGPDGVNGGDEDAEDE